MSARPYSLAVLAAAAMAAPASAESVRLQFDKTTSSSAVTVKYNNGANTVTGTPGPYYWHQSPGNGVPLNSALPNGVTTFCVELSQTISTGSTYTYTTTPLASGPGISPQEATLISQLYATNFNTAWNSTSFTGSNASTAFQLALWELVYDTGSSLSLSGGNFFLTTTPANANAVAIAQGWLTDLKDGKGKNLATVFPNSQLVYLSNGSNQDQLALVPIPPTPPGPGNPVPAPAGAVLLGMGGLLAAARNLRRRATAPTTVA